MISPFLSPSFITSGWTGCLGERNPLAPTNRVQITTGLSGALPSRGSAASAAESRSGVGMFHPLTTRRGAESRNESSPRHERKFLESKRKSSSRTPYD